MYDNLPIPATIKQWNAFEFSHTSQCWWGHNYLSAGLPSAHTAVSTATLPVLPEKQHHCTPHAAATEIEQAQYTSNQLLALPRTMLVAIATAAAAAAHRLAAD
jgi:hypothetical protein